jgi:hypothetical protein
MRIHEIDTAKTPQKKFFVAGPPEARQGLTGFSNNHRFISVLSLPT